MRRVSTFLCVCFRVSLLVSLSVCWVVSRGDTMQRSKQERFQQRHKETPKFFRPIRCGSLPVPIVVIVTTAQKTRGWRDR